MNLVIFVASFWFDSCCLAVCGGQALVFLGDICGPRGLNRAEWSMVSQSETGAAARVEQGADKRFVWLFARSCLLCNR